MEITAIGIDLAKSVFQLHGVDSRGKCVLRKKLSRSQLPVFIAQLKPCLIGMEACAGANFWAREFEKLGHRVKLIAPQFVKPFVKSNKNDALDAEAICEALLRPSMRFVAPKSIEQQDVQSLHRVRSRQVAARTALCNEMRGLLAEYGVVLAGGITHLRKNLASTLESSEQQQRITPSGRRLFEEMAEELRELDEKITTLERKIANIHCASEKSQRLAEIPGVGKLTATAVLAAVGDPKAFKNGREFSAWIGLVPKQHSSGGKDKLLGISKRGDVYLRTLLIHGARASIRFLDRYPESHRKHWLENLIKRRGKNRAIVALANKNARQMWVLLAKNEEYRAA
jgi:transposase